MGIENADRLRRAYATFSEHKTLDWEMFDPAIEHDQRAGLFLDGVFYGPEGVRAALEEIHADWDDLRFDTEELVDLGDRYLVMLRMRARVRDSEAELDAQIAHIWEFRDGRAVRWGVFGDRAEALRSLSATGPFNALH
jgi:ketosteroid isomerase-like protein